MDQYAFDTDQRMAKEITGRFGGPSFMRRAKQVETAWTDLRERIAKMRLEHLEIVRLRLGQLHALAGGWERLQPLISDHFGEVRSLYEELQPRLRMPLEPATAPRILRSALGEMREAMEAFNQRWTKVLAKVDLKPMNDARDAYNQYYLLEKECALGSSRIARLGYHRLEPVTLDDLRKEFPLLKLPRIKE